MEMVSVWEIESEKVHYGKLCDIQFKWGNAQTHNSPNRFLLAIFRSILFSIAKLWLLWISHGCYFWHVFVLCLEFNRLMHRINLTSMRMFIFNRSIEIIECRRCTLNFQLLAAKCMLFWMFMTISDSIVEGVQSIMSLAHSCYGRKRCACFTYKNWYRTRTPLFALVFINIYDFIPCVTINFWNAHKWLVTETLSRSFKMRQFSTLAACSTSRRRKKLFNFPIYEFRFWKFGWTDFRSNANRQKNGINKAAAAKLNPK